MKRFNFSIKALLLSIIGILNILIAAPLGYMAYESWKNYTNAREITYVSEVNHDLYQAQKHLSLERGAAFSLLYVPPESFDILNNQVKTQRAESQAHFMTALTKINQADGNTARVKTAVDELKMAWETLELWRTRLDTLVLQETRDTESPVPQEYYTSISNVINKTNQLIAAYSNPVFLHSPEITRQMRITRLIWEISEYASQEYAILGQLIARGKFPAENTKNHLLSLRNRINYGLEVARSAILDSNWQETIEPALIETETHYTTIFEQLKDIFYEQNSASEDAFYPITVEMWLQLASESVSSLHELTDAVLAINQRDVLAIEDRALWSIYISVFLFLCAIAISIYSWWLIMSRVIRPINSMIEALYKETKLSPQFIEENSNPDEIFKLRQVLKVFQQNSRQLVRERDKAEAANIAKSEFLANMSHEIRTPMNVVVGLSNILARTEPLTDKQAEFIRTLQISADSLLTLINDLLDFSKIQADSLELENIPFNLCNLVKDLSLVKTFKAEEKHLIFKTDFKDIQGKEYIGDPTRIRQILVNLCGNAIKFTEKGKITLKVHALPGSQPNHENIVISIIDTGIGIANDKLDYIFEKFTQEDSSIIRKYGGTGLGLSITKSLVNMMGGKITVESTRGVGTTFRVTLPLRLKPQQNLFELESKSVKPEATKILKKSDKILLVEDYYPNAVVAGTFLEEFGYEFDLAENGYEAVQKYMENGYGVILMDVQMPNMDGYQATRAIRKYERENGKKPVRIVGLTAHTSKQSVQNCLESGMNDCIFKPFDQKKLKEKLEA